jgi:hypothetical protein
MDHVVVTRAGGGAKLVKGCTNRHVIVREFLTLAHLTTP